MTTTTKRSRVVAVLNVTLVALAGGAACGGAPVLVMYDRDLAPQLALELRDARGFELRVTDAFAFDDDLVVLGARILGERCESGVTDGDYGLPPLPYRSCADIAHGFVARVDRAGEVVWSLAAEGSEDASCAVDAFVDDGVLRVSASCADGVTIDGAQVLDDAVDPATGERVDAAPFAGTIYDFIAPLDDGTAVGVFFDGTVTRGTLNENGVLIDAMWSHSLVGADGYFGAAGLHVVGDEVLVAGFEGATPETPTTFAVLSLATGDERFVGTSDNVRVLPSAGGWWSTPSVDATVLQHRDRTGAVTAEVGPSTRPWMLSASDDELWVLQADAPLPPVRVDLQ